MTRPRIDTLPDNERERVRTANREYKRLSEARKRKPAEREMVEREAEFQRLLRDVLDLGWRTIDSSHVHRLHEVLRGEVARDLVRLRELSEGKADREYLIGWFERAIELFWRRKAR